MIAEVLHLGPAEVDNLTPLQLNQAIEYVENIRRAHEEAAKRAQQRYRQAR